MENGSSNSSMEESCDLVSQHMKDIYVSLLVLFDSGGMHIPQGQCGSQRTTFSGALSHFPSCGFQRSQVIRLSSKCLHLLSHLDGLWKTFGHPDCISVVAAIVVGFIILLYLMLLSSTAFPLEATQLVSIKEDSLTKVSHDQPWGIHEVRCGQDILRQLAKELNIQPPVSVKSTESTAQGLLTSPLLGCHIKIGNPRPSGVWLPLCHTQPRLPPS